VSWIKNLFSPHEILYVDKTGREIIQTKPRKTLVKRGIKQEGAIKTAERADLLAAVIWLSEGGNFIPRIIIFPGRNMQVEMTDVAPRAAVFHVTSKEGHN